MDNNPGKELLHTFHKLGIDLGNCGLNVIEGWFDDSENTEFLTWLTKSLSEENVIYENEILEYEENVRKNLVPHDNEYQSAVDKISEKYSGIFDINETEFDIECLEDETSMLLEDKHKLDDILLLHELFQSIQNRNYAEAIRKQLEAELNFMNHMNINELCSLSSKEQLEDNIQFKSDHYDILSLELGNLALEVSEKYGNFPSIDIANQEESMYNIIKQYKVYENIPFQERTTLMQVLCKLIENNITKSDLDRLNNFHLESWNLNLIKNTTLSKEIRLIEKNNRLLTSFLTNGPTSEFKVIPYKIYEMFSHIDNILHDSNNVVTTIVSIWKDAVLESYMTETFITNSFRKMGENPLNVKVMRNKFTGEPAGYCFVHFATDEEAIDAMHKLNGKPIPGTNPVVRFRLNNASNTGRSLLDREFSVWVGDLSPDVDDYNLYRVFSSKYNTIKTAKVILDSSGFSKGYGFVRFGSEDEQKDSLTSMNGYVGLGTKALKICNAVPKPKGAVTTTASTTSNATTTYTTAGDYSQYYDPSAYWQSYASWQAGYYDQGDASQVSHETYHHAVDTQGHHVDKKDEDELELIEHSLPLDVDKMNREAMEQDNNFWGAIESSRWLPCDVVDAA
ncbi:trna selenocysteine 1-associated protein 1-related-related [Holotrichia oblita]|uniref:Trna selenocysteine 1-associated protein 1-related-related n=1 Tax=Holotrichia oblita TaxID=644536 RepID=A0ACB9TNM3_HOLOL|nr:trna selenocysteine 1-associated protein 1-related-related [Holotrichia oblita]